MFPKLVEIKPLNDYNISLKYSDGVAGHVSLKSLTDTEVFSNWKTGTDFNKPFIPRNNVIAWSDEMEVDADSLYLELRGISFEQLKKENSVHAAAK